jgi:hypothetical protein
MSEPRQAPPYERHLQTIISGIALAILLWVGVTTQNTSVELAKLGVEMQYLRTQINANTQALKLPDGKFDLIERRLDNIEQQLTIHMNGKESHD